MRNSRRLPLLLAASALLAACGTSPPAQFYTLQPAVQSQPAPVAPVDFQIEITPVSVPLQADQPQIMLRERDGEGELIPLYSHRWSAPLADEIGSALSDALTRKLGTLNVQTLQPVSGTPVWRVQVDVQRFDMVAQGPARLDATWRVRPVNHKKGRTLVCRSAVEVAPVGAGVAALVQAQQGAVALLADTIASAVQAQGQRATAPNGQVALLGCT